MEIKRDKYLKELEAMRHTGFVKIVTGIRRCGKSYLLFNLFDFYLRSRGVEASHIVKVALDGYESRHLRNPDSLYEFLDHSITDDGMHYFLLDEIQLVDHFAEVLNAFLRRGNVDIYVTGSNARLLSKDVITEFRGRGHEIRMFPLTFAEYMSVYDGTRQRALDEYMTYGGLPQIFDYKTDRQKAQFLKNLFAETYLRDIKERNAIRKNDDLEELLDIIASDVGCLTNPNKLAATFKSVKRSDVSNATVKKYLDCLQDAFLIERATRYDLKGRRYVDSPFKYYFCDMGLRNARLNFRQTEKTHLMENVVYNELLARGYNVDVGVLPVRRMNSAGQVQRSQLEIDFVCNLGSKRYYIQSAYAMPTPEKRAQEEAALRQVDDSFKKIIVTADDAIVHRDEAGITTMSIYDFLLDERSLDL